MIFFIAGIVLRVFDRGYRNTDDTDLRNLNGLCLVDFVCGTRIGADLMDGRGFFLLGNLYGLCLLEHR